eukprot:COSAG01_NODE_7919_length_2992_cov_4.821984_4_plen_208_part_00
MCCSPSATRMSTRVVDNPLNGSDNNTNVLPKEDNEAQVATVEQEDTDAVTSPAPEDLLLTRLASIMIRPVLVDVYIAVVGVALPVAFSTYHDGGLTAQVSVLTRIFDMCGGTAMAILTLAAARSFRRVTAAGQQMERLGAGETKISARALRGLRRSHVMLCVVCVFFVLVGVLCLVTATKVGSTSKITGRIITTRCERAPITSSREQ